MTRRCADFLIWTTNSPYFIMGSFKGNQHPFLTAVWWSNVSYNILGTVEAVQLASSLLTEAQRRQMGEINPPFLSYSYTITIMCVQDDYRVRTQQLACTYTINPVLSCTYMVDISGTYVILISYAHDTYLVRT